MTNEIKTHRLIVTLPNSVGEEADIVASDIEERLNDRVDGGGWTGAIVTHALGESLPDGVSARVSLTRLCVRLSTHDGDAPRYLTPLEARQLAGVLLHHADEIEA